jgi:small conductance mechanosensitive channel
VDEQLGKLLETPDALTQLAVEFGPRVLSALLVLVAGFFVMRWVGRLAGRGLSRFPLEPPAYDLILRVVKLLVFALFVVMALQNLGIDLLPLLAGIGIAGAGIALALQGVLGNLAAGLTIIFTRPFRVGEYVSIAGEDGRVQEISLFSTTLRHADLSQVVIPNRKIVGEILHNYGVIRQLDMSVGVAYATDLDQAIAVIHEVLAASPRVLQEPAPVVRVDLLGDFAINIAIKPWVAVSDFAPAAGEIYPEIIRAFRERNIEIPFPILRTMVERVS